MWRLKAKDYLNIVDEDAMINIFVVSEVKQTKQIFVQEDTFSLKKPDLSMQVLYLNVYLNLNWIAICLSLFARQFQATVKWTAN